MPKFGEATLTLTSMMDMFTIILVFLLMNYSTQGDILVSDPRLKLPVSTSDKPPRMRLIVQATYDDIIVDGVRVAGVKEALAGVGFLIKPLYGELNEHARKTEFIARKNAAVKFTGEVIIQGDKRIPFVLLEKIMFTCGQAGYNTISLAVMSSRE
ncbi:MAG: biopolymer transporter ExbD [Deltaproteobacteria bacterium]|nr:biopolymer transporter ExbD [Deltaproteobacteria bacterium]